MKKSHSSENLPGNSFNAGFARVDISPQKFPVRPAVHHMGRLSAGYPGVLCDRLQAKYGSEFGCVFLNGVCGNIIHRDYTDAEKSRMLTKEYVGETPARLRHSRRRARWARLTHGKYRQDGRARSPHRAVFSENVAAVETPAGDVRKILDHPAAPIPAGTVDVDEACVHIRYRDITELERNMDNPAWFVNVFPLLLKLDWFRWSLAKLKALHAASDGQDAVVQIMRLGDVCLAGIPAEYFTT